ncbi:unnamed protein product [Hermetia illucens]|uniref:G-protein coupled receptors family 1 profile domain-containing protein n=1 Tax=Hermetia illucens TaxID=343691 RepID=A0A7R8V0J5_HERIL|nr:probable G-protein coupled receptor B0563.6 [Hermetia illucens]XP_037921840.1 probable G-protein coupled receptor B0563.6 [Hermetia illucens]CAD7089999.1 unnamed protein product [Hermetia illucens]
MITRLYPSEEEPNLCSVIFGANLSSGNDDVDMGADDGPTNESREDPRTEALRQLSYGIILPVICALGIIGNVLNLIVLTRRNMRGTAYIYMRGYSAAALLAIIFAIPFGIRMLVHKDKGRWQDLAPAFYSAHLELFLGNGCLGVGVLMLLTLTIERYVSVCHPGYVRPFMGPPSATVVFIPVVTFIIYLPSIFRGVIVRCLLENGTIVFYRKDNEEFLRSLFYSVYKVILEVIFKLVPTVLIAGFNLRIMMVYRQTCERRRRMTLSRNSCFKEDDPRKFAEERRLTLLLGSTSILFLVCVSPMAILHVTLSRENLSSYSFQVFRALANLLELTNYSITFYIYCLFSEDFRNTLIRTFKWPWFSNPICKRKNDVALKSKPLLKSEKNGSKNHIHNTTTSGLCTIGGRSSI